jgi:hypothetical protein
MTREFDEDEHGLSLIGLPYDVPPAAGRPSGAVKGLSPNSATYWLPRLGVVSALSDLVPRTIVVPYDHAAAVGEIEGGDKYAEWSAVVSRVRVAAETIGYPAFIRTDLASAKHDGPEGYMLASPLDVTRLLSHIVGDNEMKLWMNPEDPCAFLVRQFLDLEAPFSAFGGLPISREWRLFATPSEILCAHPYWPGAALEDVWVSDEGWRAKLADLHERPRADEWRRLTEAALMAAAACDRIPAWSVDFARDTSGKWWLIDMAVAEQSWHWPSCANAQRAGAGGADGR